MSLSGSYQFSEPAYANFMHFTFRALSVPSRLIAELYSLLGFCVFLRNIDMHLAFRILPVQKQICGQTQYTYTQCAHVHIVYQHFRYLYQINENNPARSFKI